MGSEKNDFSVTSLIVKHVDFKFSWKNSSNDLLEPSATTSPKLFPADNLRKGREDLCQFRLLVRSHHSPTKTTVDRPLASAHN